MVRTRTTIRATIHNWRHEQPKRQDTGGSAIEYAAVVILVGLIAAAIFGLGLDTQISDAIQGGVNEALSGGGSDGGDGGNDGEAPPEP